MLFGFVACSLQLSVYRPVRKFPSRLHLRPALLRQAVYQALGVLIERDHLADSLFPNREGTTKRILILVQRGGTQKHTQSVKQHHRRSAADRDCCFHFDQVFTYKSKPCTVLNKPMFLSLENKTTFLFHCFCVCCIFAQGCSLNMHFDLATK